MRTEEFWLYGESPDPKCGQQVLKRIIDIVISAILLILAIWIKGQPGTGFYRQERVTIYRKHFWIHKFWTMVSNADKIGTIVTIGKDSQIAEVASKLRGHRLDELPQVIEFQQGTMSFVGTRSEADR